MNFSDKIHSWRVFRHVKDTKYSADPTYVPDSVSNVLKFVWRNDSLVKIGDNILGLASADGKWQGYGDEEIIVSKQKDKPVEVPSNAGAAADYSLLYGADMYSLDYKDFKLLKVLINDKNVYVKGIDDNLPEAWVKGEMENGKVYFKKQYLGVDTSRGYGFHTYFVPAKTDSVLNEWGFYSYISSEIAQTVFDLDATTGVLKSDSDFVLNFGRTDPTKNTLEVYRVPRFAPWKEVSVVPAAPVIRDYIPFDERNGFAVLRFTLPKEGVKGEFLDVNKLYYNLYIDDDSNPMLFQTDEYPDLKENMTDIPYNFNTTQKGILASGTAHNVFLFSTDPDKIGVQLWYTGGGKKTHSDIVWYDVTAAGIRPQNTGTKVVGCDFYDLGGRRLTHPSKGFFIKTVKYADGTVRTLKMVKR